MPAKNTQVTPVYATVGHARLYLGDCLGVLKTLPDNSVNCCVTSPPYYGLRDYGQDGQIGLESTPDAYVARLVEVFREVRRVLRDDGTCWVNLGDSYARTGGTDSKVSATAIVGSTRRTLEQMSDRTSTAQTIGLKPKDLIGIPWRVAFALQADGWYLRQDIIWAKPNPMPESVTDRCTKAHEYVFLLTKSERYFYDSAAVSEPADPINHRQSAGIRRTAPGSSNHGGQANGVRNYQTRNRRSVWTIPTQPYAGAHFAVYPPELVKPCILAGCPEGGTVLDPFNGSATTGAVALQLGRQYIGIELNPDYLDLSHQRLKPIAGQPDLFTAPTPHAPLSAPEQATLSFDLASSHYAR